MDEVGIEHANTAHSKTKTEKWIRFEFLVVIARLLMKKIAVITSA
jgi:hypothetical protein